MKLSPLNPNKKIPKRRFRQTSVSNEMDQAFTAEIRKHGLNKPQAIAMLVDQFNSNPWPLEPKTGYQGNLHCTWAGFEANIETVDTFAAHCAAAGVSTSEAVRQLVQRCLDTASGKLARDRLDEETAND